MDLNNFELLCNTLNSTIDYTSSGPPQVPFASPFDEASIRGIVRQSMVALPAVYQREYAQPMFDQLGSFLRRLQDQLTSQFPDDTPDDISQRGTAIVEPYVGAVYDWSVPEVRSPLQRFQAVVSDLYRSFLDKDKRSQVGAPLSEQLPALATFAHDAGAGPFTLPVDGTQQAFGASVGVVSLPSSYRNHPLIWAALTHEVGGHDVSHADPGLLDELANVVRRELSGSAIPRLGDLWAFWIDEAVADVYGLLNIGPTFAVNLAAFFTTLLTQITQPPGTWQIPRLRMVIPVEGDQWLDVHPTDLLRIHLSLGAVNELHGLAQATRDGYAQNLQQLAIKCAAGATTVDVVDYSGNAPQTVRSLDLAQMQQAAQRVGQIIATTPLNALNGHSIQDIETWDDNDEATAQKIAAALKAGQSVARLGDDAQVLAGATLALLDRPGADDYHRVTSLVNAALDESFATDPIFGQPQPDHVFLLFPRPTRGKPGAFARLESARTTARVGFAQSQPGVLESLAQVVSQAANPIDLQRQALGAIQPLLTLFGLQAVSAPLGTAFGNQRLIYVHGICPHAAGYSNPWWAALEPYVASTFGSGTLGQTRLEVLWSGAVPQLFSLAPAAAIAPAAHAERLQVADEIREVLWDRADRNVVAAAPRPTAASTPRSLLEAQGLVKIPGLSCIEDFTIYLVDDSVRQQVINCFTQVVGPLLTAGLPIDIISHSWGTVVAYEGLRELEVSGSNQPVRNFFTVGAALSIAPVKLRLRPANRDGRRPAMVQRWVNLNARGDVVGGPLQGRPYQVNADFLNLDPFGCQALLGVVNPECAHGSYFVSGNVAVNRDIFARFI